MLTVGDLFSGIGGFSLGLERAGMRTAWFAETDSFASQVLRKHWPAVPNHGDVRSVRAGAVEPVDVICGGFPCQDISVAGGGRGLEGERSGLWSEFARIVGELRPRYAIVENVGALTIRWLDRVLGDLTALGYDAEWHVVPAAAVGAPHLRERVWIIAQDATDAGRDDAVGRLPGVDSCAASARESEAQERQRIRAESSAMGGAAADPNSRRRERERIAEHGGEQGAPRHQSDGLGEGGRGDRARATPDASSERVEGGRPDRIEVTFAPALARLLGRDDAGAVWRDGPTESPIRGVDDGIPPRLDRGRLACLGNAVVPQITEIIGRAIIAGIG